MDRTKINTELTRYIARLKKTVNPEKVILFGSFARNEATDWSDIDVLVISKFADISKNKRFDVLYDLQDGLVRDHDIHAYGVTPKEYENAKPWTIFNDIKKEGVVLYER